MRVPEAIIPRQLLGRHLGFRNTISLLMMAALSGLYALLQGTAGIAYGKLSFESIRTPSSIAFIFIDFLRVAALGLPINAVLVWLGARIIDHNDALRDMLNPSFHYSQLLFLLSAVGGAFCAWWLNHNRLWHAKSAPLPTGRAIDIVALIGAIHFTNPFRLRPRTRRRTRKNQAAPIPSSAG